ncbi:MAG: hypothetical protein H0X31_20955, partial [Nostocaceae cyanobacterium]|nr:hypothetical protein [Nostocaceae cyanobacterium]
HYDRTVKELRNSVTKYYTSSPSEYVSTFHQFSHITIRAFYEYVLPSENGLDKGYGALTQRAIFTDTLPRGFDIWKRLGSMRNRVDHPFDEKTKTHSKKITIKEVEDLHKELQVALQEIFDVWLNFPPLIATKTTVPVDISPP